MVKPNLSLPELESRIKSTKVSKMAMSERSEDCPALQVCSFLHNDRKACAKGGSGLMNVPTEICLASVVMLLARAQGFPVGPEPEQEEEFKRSPIGYFAKFDE